MRRRTPHPSGTPLLRVVVPSATLVAVGALAIPTARLRLALRETGRIRDQIVGAAHDLKNPLTVIRGNAQHLRQQVARQPSLPAEQRVRLVTGLARIDAATGNMLGLVNELLDTVRLQAGEDLQLLVQPTDLVALAHRAVGAAQAGTEDHQIVVQADVPALVGQWDGTRLERVLDNLLSNAVKYSQEGGKITVGRWREDGWAGLRVQDQGIGSRPAPHLPPVCPRHQCHWGATGQRAGSGWCPAHRGAARRDDHHRECRRPGQHVRRPAAPRPNRHATRRCHHVAPGGEGGGLSPLGGRGHAQ